MYTVDHENGATFISFTVAITDQLQIKLPPCLRYVTALPYKIWVFKYRPTALTAANSKNSCIYSKYQPTESSFINICMHINLWRVLISASSPIHALVPLVRCRVTQRSHGETHYHWATLLHGAERCHHLHQAHVDQQRQLDSVEPTTTYAVLTTAADQLPAFLTHLKNLK